MKTKRHAPGEYEITTDLATYHVEREDGTGDPARIRGWWYTYFDGRYTVIFEEPTLRDLKAEIAAVEAEGGIKPFEAAP